MPTDEHPKKTETFEFAHAIVRVTSVDDIVYMHVSGVYSDDVALRMIQYLDERIESSPEPLIRVWDAGGIPVDAFQLTNQCVATAAEWAKRVKARKAGSVAYMVSPTSVSFGMSRMYALRADLDATDVIVLQSLKDLPPRIRRHLPM